MANTRDVNDFVEQLSNCIGEISGDEVVFKKIPYSSEYVVRMRNHNEKVANIWYDYETDKIIVQLVPAFRNMEYRLDDLTIDTIKGIGQMVRKNALNRIGESMEFEEAKQILNENDYVLKERFEHIDEIRVPEWLWVAYETGDTSNLEDEEIVILHIFEKDHKKHHLEANEEPNFYRTNDVTDEGGMCYTVQVFEDKKNENYNHPYNNGYLVESKEKPLFTDNERLSNNKWLEDYNFACDKINTFTVGDREVIDANEARAAFKEMAKSIANLEKMIYIRNN